MLKSHRFSSELLHFSPELAKMEIPLVFPSPFSHEPSSLAVQAGLLLQESLKNSITKKHDFHAPNGGKMFGVLVVQDVNNNFAYLCAYSGMLDTEWQLPGFVPPIFNLDQRHSFLPEGEIALEVFSKKINKLISSEKHKALENKLASVLDQQNQNLADVKLKHSKLKSQRKRERASVTNLPEDEQRRRLLILSLESQRDRKEKKEITALESNKVSVAATELNIVVDEIKSLKEQRGNLSRSLHEQVFAGYQLINSVNEMMPMRDCFTDILPPGGAGDCAAPKLIQYAIKNDLKPLALAEFWWGRAPASGIRHHAEFYPACRGKCHPILPFMLKGLQVEPQQVFGASMLDVNEPKIVYEDEVLLVVNKPCGLLSIPGKDVQDSVYTRLQKRYPDASGPLLVHRLDLATSGLLLVAKNKETHKLLQKQFLSREIKKRYVAILKISSQSSVLADEGMIALPLRGDLNDRPRQMVCYSHGKVATTKWKMISREKNRIRIYFYPITGRTHQLRVHAAHVDGLNAPIVGDILYGFPEKRLCLHAEFLSFIHPKSGKRLEIEIPAEF